MTAIALPVADQPAARAPSRRSRIRRAAALVFGTAVAVGTVAVVGTGPLLRGVLAVSPAAVMAAALLTGVATGAAVWRWRTVSSALGLPMPWLAAVGAYYRSQFVNTVLPGGVVGDVHRAYRQGRRSGDLPLAARAVATERVAGQLVQAITTVLVLATLGLTAPVDRSSVGWPIGSPVPWLPAVGWLGVALAVAIALAVTIGLASSRARGMLRRELSLLRMVFRRPRASLSIVAASLVVVGAHVTTFVVACLAVGIHGSPRELVAVALIALAAASLPLNVGGWGPREAASAAAFATVGWGAGAGLAASTAFGILTLAAVLPGGFVLIAQPIAAALAARTAHRIAPRAASRTVHPLPHEGIA